MLQILFDATLVPDARMGLLLIGGSCPTSGNVDLIFQYDEKFGFRLLPNRLTKPRSGHVAINTDFSEAGYGFESMFIKA